MPRETKQKTKKKQKQTTNNIEVICLYFVFCILCCVFVLGFAFLNYHLETFHCMVCCLLFLNFPSAFPVRFSAVREIVPSIFQGNPRLNFNIFHSEVYIPIYRCCAFKNLLSITSGLMFNTHTLGYLNFIIYLNGY